LGSDFVTDFNVVRGEIDSIVIEEIVKDFTVNTTNGVEGDEGTIVHEISCLGEFLWVDGVVNEVIGDLSKEF